MQIKGIDVLVTKTYDDNDKHDGFKVTAQFKGSDLDAFRYPYNPQVGVLMAEWDDVQKFFDARIVDAKMDKERGYKIATIQVRQNANKLFVKHLDLSHALPVTRIGE